MPKLDKDILKTLSVLDEITPYASYLDENTLSTVNDWIDTGSFALNAIMSGNFKGGVPVGRVTQFAGGSMTGKSLLVQRILANAQKKGIVPVIFDSESAIEKSGATILGLDPAGVKYIPVISIEECRNAVYSLFQKIIENNQQGKFIIAIDSLGNLESELQIKRMDKNNVSADMGSKAKAIKQLMKVLVHYASLTRTTVVCTNHVYDDPSQMFPSIEKNISGGSGVIYLPSITVQLGRKPVKADSKLEGESTANQKSFIGVIVKALTVKNRFVKQYLETELFISFQHGVNKLHGLLDIAIGLGVIEQNGPSYSFQGEKLGYYSKFRTDVAFWTKKVMPVLQERISTEWVYSDKAKDEDYDVNDTQLDEGLTELSEDLYEETED